MRDEGESTGLRGIFANLKSTLAEAIGSSRARVDLFQADVEHRLMRLLAMLIWGVVAIFCLSLGLLLAMLTVVFGLGLSLKYALGIPAVVFLALGVFGVIMLRIKKASKLDRTKHGARHARSTTPK